VSVTWHRTGSWLGSFRQARACERQQATREQARGQWSGSVLPAAAVGRPGWRRSRRKGRQSYILCVWEWRTGAAARHGGLPNVFLQCICVSRGSSTREQVDLEVREGVGIANQSGSIVSSHKSTTSSSSYSSSIARARPQHLKKAPGPSHRASSIPVYQNIIAVAKPTTATTGHRGEYPSRHPPPTTIPWQASSSPTEPRHCQALLIANPVHRGNSLSACSPPQPRLPQGLP
jgi:hypothetical protein